VLITYYIDVINIKAGSAIASNAPESIRSAASEAKFFAAACAIKRTPHINILKDRSEEADILVQFMHGCFRDQLTPSRATSLHDQVGRNSPEKPTKVEHRRKPTILCLLQFEILLNPKDSCIRKRGLVDILMYHSQQLQPP
tara:strand:- start:17 stop:439 length:423 start_codon:yes stop_codon:yes gene_type:complete